MYKIDISNIHGHGLIAIQDIPKGTTVGKSHIGMGRVNNKVLCGNITEIGSFQNHSNKPNCKLSIIRNDIYSVTTTDIKQGEELVIDFTKNKGIAVNIEYKVEDSWK